MNETNYAVAAATPAAGVRPVDPELLEAFTGKVIGDVAGAFDVLLGFIGDQTGVYRGMRELGPATAATIARATSVDERYLLEWLSAQAAAGYVEYDENDETFSLTPEQATVLAHEGHPAFIQGAFQQLVSQFTTHEHAIEVFRSGAGRSWGEHHDCCFCATDRFFRPGYAANLVESWLLALGAQAGEKRLTAVLREAGFTRVRRATETVTNMMLEARP